LWRGLLQITYSRPWRRTSLQFSQIRLTLERTFMADLAGSTLPGRQGKNYSTGAKDADKMTAKKSSARTADHRRVSLL
jgi:hypothetical protein